MAALKAAFASLPGRGVAGVDNHAADVVGLAFVGDVGSVGREGLPSCRSLFFEPSL